MNFSDKILNKQVGSENLAKMLQHSEFSLESISIAVSKMFDSEILSNPKQSVMCGPNPLQNSKMPPIVRSKHVPHLDYLSDLPVNLFR